MTTTKKYDFTGKRFAPYSDETPGIGGRNRPTTYGVYDNDKGRIHSLRSAKDIREASEQAIFLNENPPIENEQPTPENTTTAKINFIQGWTPDQFTTMQRAICKHFRKDAIKTAHGNHVKDYRGFNKLGEIMGLAYTSSSSYAGFWITNTEVYNKYHSGFRYVGFALGTDGIGYAILWDEDENELIIPL